MKICREPHQDETCFSQFGKFGKTMALASVPFGLSALSNKSFASDIGPTPNTPVGALSLALTLEYLESEFYETALSTFRIDPSGQRQEMRSHRLQRTRPTT